MAKMGRPKKEIRKEDFERLCALQCTQGEFLAWFDCCADTLEAWCKENYKDENGNGMTFSKVFNARRGLGKISLRRKQWKLADTNASMAIFLGKNILGQSEVVRVVRGQDEEIERDPLSLSLKELAEKMDKEDVE